MVSSLPQKCDHLPQLRGATGGTESPGSQLQAQRGPSLGSTGAEVCPGHLVPAGGQMAFPAQPALGTRPGTSLTSSSLGLLICSLALVWSARPADLQWDLRRQRHSGQGLRSGWPHSEVGSRGSVVPRGGLRAGGRGHSGAQWPAGPPLAPSAWREVGVGTHTDSWWCRAAGPGGGWWEGVTGTRW